VDRVLFQAYTVVTLLLGHHYAVPARVNGLIIRGFGYNFASNY